MFCPLYIHFMHFGRYTHKPLTSVTCEHNHVVTLSMITNLFFYSFAAWLAAPAGGSDGNWESLQGTQFHWMDGNISQRWAYGEWFHEVRNYFTWEAILVIRHTPKCTARTYNFENLWQIIGKYVLYMHTGGADKSLARPTSRCILFDATLVICINSINVPPTMIINRIYKTQNFLSL